MRARLLRKGFMVAAVASMLALEPMAGCASHACIQRRAEITSLVRGHDREKDALSALDSMSRYGDRYTASAVDRVPAHYERAGALARELGMPDDSSTRLNLAYAIAAVGETRAAELHRALGITYFMRYSRSMLEAVYANMHEAASERPVLAIGFNLADHNGAFYREGLALDPLLRGYRVFLFEAGGEKAFYSMLDSIASKQGKLSALVVGGHGNPGSVQLGGNDEQGQLDLSDGDELRALRKDFVSEPIVVLVSCSTGADGDAVGAVISRALGARLYAPVTPSSRTSYHLDGRGLISSVSYDVQTRNFVEGVAR
jgi:hypothetical protein